MSAPRIWAPRFEVERRADGSILMAQTGALPGHARAIPDSLVRWAAGRPDQIWLTERAGEGWRELRYAEALAQVRALATALLGLGLGPDRPLLILSENSIDHALLALAAQYGGVPYAPLSTAYSLVSTDHGKLRDIAALLRPGLVFAADGAAYGAALAAIAAPGRQVVVDIKALALNNAPELVYPVRVILNHQQLPLGRGDSGHGDSAALIPTLI
jgi:feruloyl-CoA synthase